LRSSALPLDLRAADDRIRTVFEANPGLVAAVVVRSPEDHRRRLALPCVGGADRDRVRALGIEPAPDAQERVVLPLVSDRRRLAMTRMDAGLRGQLHQLVHDRALQVVEAGRAGGPGAA